MSAKMKFATRWMLLVVVAGCGGGTTQDGGHDASVGVDAAADATGDESAADAVTAPDSGPHSDPGEVVCGDKVCKGGGPGGFLPCCHKTPGGDSICTDSPFMCQSGWMECDENADCHPTMVCCASPGAGTYGANCLDPMPCAGKPHSTICKSDKDCTNGKHCQKYVCPELEIYLCEDILPGTACVPVNF